MASAACVYTWAAGSDSLTLRARESVQGVVVHRIEVSQEDPAFGDTPADVARFFREHPIGKTATGGGMPYPILIAADGTVTQTVPLSRVTPHARLFNPTTIGVAAIGDFRRVAPAAPQRAALVAVAVELLVGLGLGVEALHGHDELSGASSDPNKECPGRHLSMSALRADVAAVMRDLAASHSERFAFVW